MKLRLNSYSVLCWRTFGSDYTRVFVGMIQAWHICIWGVSPILLCRSSQTLSDWMGSIAAQLFSSLFRDVRSGSSPGSGWATQGHSETCPEATPCSIVFDVYLGSLSCWKVNLRPSLRSWVLWSRFSPRISLYNVPFIFPSILTSLTVPAAEKHPHSVMLPPPCFTVGMVPGSLHMWRLAFRPRSSILVSSDQGILFLMVWESFKCLLANSKLAVHVPFTEEWLLPDLKCCSNGCPSGRFSHLHRWTLEPCQSEHRVLGDLQCCRYVLVPFSRSVPRHNPVSELFFQPHGLVFALTCTVNCGTLYRHLCAFPNHVQSIEFTTGGL